MKKQKRKIVVDEYTSISSVWLIPDDFRAGETDALILAHGAGNSMNHPFMNFVHESLARAGFLTIKFNFAYMEQGRKAPDVAAKLERTFLEVIMRVRSGDTLRPRRLFIGGKSMGGRIASNLAAQGEDVAGLVFLGYPLHPPNQPAKLRAAHLREISCPMLFISGTRDAFCDLKLLKHNLKPLKKRATLHVIEEGDHAFHVPKRTGRTDKDVCQDIVRVMAEWLRGI